MLYFAVIYGFIMRYSKNYFPVLVPGWQKVIFLSLCPNSWDLLLRNWEGKCIEKAFYCKTVDTGAYSLKFYGSVNYVSLNLSRNFGMNLKNLEKPVYSQMAIHCEEKSVRQQSKTGTAPQPNSFSGCYLVVTRAELLVARYFISLWAVNIN